MLWWNAIIFVLSILAILPLALFGNKLGEISTNLDWNKTKLETINELQWVFWLGLVIALLLVIFYHFLTWFINPNNHHQNEINLFKIIKQISSVVLIMIAIILTTFSAIIINRNLNTNNASQNLLFVGILIGSLIMILGFISAIYSKPNKELNLKSLIRFL